jgi:catechol 2,3-dioxygenase
LVVEHASTGSENDVSLPADTALGRVHLRVANLDQSLHFYRDLLGLVELRSEGNRTELGTRNRQPLLTLTAIPGTLPRPQGVVGLYHYALLFPTRRDLGRTLLHLFQQGWPFQGFSDHGVSEAAYLADPDGNGIELYADRPREDWPRENGQIAMTTLALNVNSLIRTVDGEEWTGVANGTRVGHIHLHVSDLERAGEFYRDVLGFDVTAANYPGALFLAAGGYHHHIGLNTWLRQRAPAPHAAGLLGYELIVPERAAVEQITARAAEHGSKAEATSEGVRLVDPDGNLLTIT